MHPTRRILTTVLLAAGVAACAAERPGEGQAAGECRAQAISDTKEIPGIVAESHRDAFFKSCMAARGY